MKNYELDLIRKQICVDLFNIDFTKSYFENDFATINMIDTLARVFQFRNTNNGKSSARAFYDKMKSIEYPF